MKKTLQVIGGLDCTIFQDRVQNTEVRSLAVILHGYCAKSEGLARQLFDGHGLSVNGDMVAVFPQGPILIDNDRWAKSGDTGWWKYEQVRLDDFEFRGRPLLEIDEKHSGVSHAAGIVKEAIAGIRDKIFPSVTTLVMCGFSQGAILATEVALDPDMNVAALGIFSGTMTCRSRWKKRIGLKDPNSIKVVQSHGAADHILKIEQARELLEAFKMENHSIEYFETAGGHALQKEAVSRFGEVWENLGK